MSRLNDLLAPLQLYKDDLSGRYEALNTRERLLVAGLGVLLCIACVYFLLWLPLVDAAEKAKQGYETQVELNAWMREKSVFFQSPTGNKRTLRGSLLSQANQSASRFGLTVNGAEPKPDDRLRIWMDDVPVDAVLRWLHSLYDTFGVKVESINLEKQALEGRVRVNLVLEK